MPENEPDDNSDERYSHYTILQIRNVLVCNFGGNIYFIVNITNSIIDLRCPPPLCVATINK